MLRVFHDFETQSRVEIGLRGATRYAMDKSTDILCLAYGTTAKDIRIWRRGDPKPKELFDLMEAADTVNAWNAPFERLIWHNIAVKRLGWPEIPLSKYRCTMAKAKYNNRPGKLDTAGEILKLPKALAKDKEGHTLMLKLSTPQKSGRQKGQFILEADAPELYEKLYRYCMRDVLAEMTIDEMLVDMPEREQELWALDRTLNERGCPIDLPYCKNAVRLVEEIGEKAQTEIHELTNGAVYSTTQVAKLLEWINNRGVNIGNMKAENVAAALESPIDPLARRALELRQIGAPAAVKKYNSAVSYTSDDQRAREQLMYYGASQTGRFAGSGIQLHNLFRETASDSIIDAIALGDLLILEAMVKNPMQALQTGVRAMVAAGEGNSLLISDFSAIEARVVLWMARCKRGLQIFHDYDAGKGPEPYRVVGGRIFSVDPSKIEKNSRERGAGKAAVLGLGFGMGPTKFQSAAKTLGGVDLDAATCEKTVSGWRKAHPEVPRYWRTLGEGFAAATNGAKEFDAGSVKFSNVKGSVAIRLPSGRQLFYHEPKVKRDGNIEFTDPRRGRIHTWAGLLCENVVQATARDMMTEALFRIEQAGLNPVLHIHDEIVCEVPDEDVEQKEKQMHELMQVIPEWAKGCPIVAATHVSKRLTK